ncbi:MAG TPA: carboxypeptidase regulatory-like domain-containing protein [Burkholderiales bacterium]|nr:carboxypeptidase regulatory-like domain-containing protein [Burkholderiales bacterium]
MRLKQALLAFSVVAAFAAATAFAQPVRVQAHAGARYVSGGVGQEERAALEAMRGEFNLRVTFAAQRSGGYLAGVGVGVEDSKGREVFRTVAQGPWLYARLAPGRYRLTASYSGRRQTRQVAVPGKGHVSLDLYWQDPSSLEEKNIAPRRPGGPK